MAAQRPGADAQADSLTRTTNGDSRDMAEAAKSWWAKAILVGAVIAAEWLCEKRGFYNFTDIFE